MDKCLEILVVDDEEIMRNLFIDILQDEGYKVTTVNNGKEAERIVKEKFFPIAFVDVHMPVMDGVKTLKMLRQLTPNTAVVMMDSMPIHALEESMTNGAVTCIHKPFNVTEVIAIVNKIRNKQ
ncbi:MAG: response regulator [Candidatus Omnitrophota bacterium]